MFLFSLRPTIRCFERGFYNFLFQTHNSADATIGPRLFLTCPVDLLSAQVWFTDLWNYTIVPYLVEAAREGLQLHGQRAPWEDPLEWVKQSYPFEHKSSQELVSVREDDITAGETTVSNRDSDPLVGTLMVFNWICVDCGECGSRNVNRELFIQSVFCFSS